MPLTISTSSLVLGIEVFFFVWLAAWALKVFVEVFVPTRRKPVAILVVDSLVLLALALFLVGVLKFS